MKVKKIGDYIIRFLVQEHFSCPDVLMMIQKIRIGQKSHMLNHVDRLLLMARCDELV